MKKFTLLGLGLLAVTTIAQADVAPYYHSTREIQAILASEEVANKLGMSDLIDSIVRDGRTYTVTARECAVQVKVVYGKTDAVGPLPITLEVGETNCLPQ